MIESIVAQKLNLFNVDKLNILDIGCRDGCARRMIQPGLKRPSFWIGFDPSDHNRMPTYDHYFQFAIDNVPSETEVSFKECVADPGTNSLLEMNVECITHDTNEYDRKWYVGKRIEDKINTTTTKVNSAFNLLKSINFSDPIHFVKVDAQGKDVSAVKSLGPYLDKTYYVQIESAMTHNKDITLYKGQPIFEEDKEEMEKLGFRVLYIEDYGAKKDAPPEADVLFYNIKLISPVITSHISAFKNGWFIGNFEPALLKTDKFEAAAQFHPKGFIGQKHYHKESVEFNLVVAGKVNICGRIMNPGDIFMFLPNEISESEFLEDTLIVVLRTPSVPKDKYIV